MRQLENTSTPSIEVSTDTKQDVATWQTQADGADSCENGNCDIAAKYDNDFPDLDAFGGKDGSSSFLENDPLREIMADAAGTSSLAETMAGAPGSKMHKGEEGEGPFQGEGFSGADGNSGNKNEGQGAYTFLAVGANGGHPASVQIALGTAHGPLNKKAAAAPVDPLALNASKEQLKAAEKQAERESEDAKRKAVAVTQEAQHEAAQEIEDGAHEASDQLQKSLEAATKADTLGAVVDAQLSQEREHGRQEAKVTAIGAELLAAKATSEEEKERRDHDAEAAAAKERQAEQQRVAELAAEEEREVLAKTAKAQATLETDSQQVMQKMDHTLHFAAELRDGSPLAAESGAASATQKDMKTASPPRAQTPTGPAAGQGSGSTTQPGRARERGTGSTSGGRSRRDGQAGRAQGGQDSVSRGSKAQDSVSRGSKSAFIENAPQPTEVLSSSATNNFLGKRHGEEQPDEAPLVKDRSDGATTGSTSTIKKSADSADHDHENVKMNMNEELKEATATSSTSIYQDQAAPTTAAALASPSHTSARLTEFGGFLGAVLLVCIFFGIFMVLLSLKLPLFFPGSVLHDNSYI
ncbi:unnamed protein product [Amoebophrya sp. A25]|nr:unnamed protein product [Amoebophrya sp. A25]|eukprot:GSA25T00014449001.1